MMQVRPDRFTRAIENVRGLLARRGSAPSPNVTLQFLLDRENAHRLPEMYRLGADIGVDRVAVGMVTPIPLERIAADRVLTNDDVELLRPGLREILEADRDRKLLQLDFPLPAANALLASLRNELGVAPEHVYTTAPSFREQNGQCFFAWYSATIRGNGDLYPCCMLLNPEYKPLGNLVTDPGFQQHWQGPAFGALREEMRDVMLTGGEVIYRPEDYPHLRVQCVQEGLCYLKNMFFRADAAFYEELGAALDVARPREVSITGTTDARRRQKLVLYARYHRFKDRTRPLRRWMKRHLRLPLTSE
jgi:hypothetical protein